MNKLFSAALLASTLISAPTFAQQAQNSLTWGFSSEIETLDPYVTAKRTSQLIIRNMLENLVVREPATGAAKPGLATAWKWIDPTTLEFTLRKGVTFHDGTPLTASLAAKLVTEAVGRPANQRMYTALRDITELVERGVLKKSAASGRSTSYELSPLT